MTAHRVAVGSLPKSFLMTPHRLPVGSLPRRLPRATIRVSDQLEKDGSSLLVLNVKRLLFLIYDACEERPNLLIRRMNTVSDL